MHEKLMDPSSPTQAVERIASLSANISINSISGSRVDMGITQRIDSDTSEAFKSALIDFYHIQPTPWSAFVPSFQVR